MDGTLNTVLVGARPRLPRFFALAPASAALAAALIAVRYFIQGTGNVYSDVARAFYVEDPVIGWVQTQERWVWLGLDALGLTAAIAVGAFGIGWLARRALARSAANPGPDGAARVSRLARVLLVLTAIGAMVSPLTLTLPVMAFGSGMPPDAAVASLPTDAASSPISGAVASSPLPAGAYAIVAHPEASVVIAQIAAGGERFDGRFTDVSGSFEIGAGGLAATQGRAHVAVSSLDTGLALRSTHAKEDLKEAEHPRITMTLAGITPEPVRADGTTGYATTVAVSIMGRDLRVPVAGQIQVLSAEQREALSVTADHAAIVRARFTLDVATVGLAPDDYDEQNIAVTARLLVAYQARGSHEVPRPQHEPGGTP